MIATLAAAPVATTAITPTIAAIARRRLLGALALLSVRLAMPRYRDQYTTTRDMRLDGLRLRRCLSSRLPLDEGCAERDACLLNRVNSIRPPGHGLPLVSLTGQGCSTSAP